MEVPEKVKSPQPSPDAKKVAELLKDVSNKSKTKEVELEVNAEDLMDGEPESQRPEVDTPVDPTFGEHTPTRNNQDPWAYSGPDETKVVVTDKDKDMFFKAVMNETPVKTSVEIPFGPGDPVKIECRSLSNFEIDVIYEAIEKLQVDGKITTTAQFMTMLQRFSIILQVLSFAGKSTKPASIDGLEMGEAVAKLLEVYREKAQDVDQTRWQVIVVALRVFSIKMKVCNDNILNENFWSPADTD